MQAVTQDGMIVAWYYLRHGSALVDIIATVPFFYLVRAARGRTAAHKPFGAMLLGAVRSEASGGQSLCTVHCAVQETQAAASHAHECITGTHSPILQDFKACKNLSALPFVAMPP